MTQTIPVSNHWYDSDYPCFKPLVWLRLSLFQTTGMTKQYLCFEPLVWLQTIPVSNHWYDSRLSLFQTTGMTKHCPCFQPLVWLRLSLCQPTGMTQTIPVSNHRYDSDYPCVKPQVWLHLDKDSRGERGLILSLPHSRRTPDHLTTGPCPSRSGSERTSFSFSSKRHRSSRKGPYALRPVFQQSPQGCPRNSASICLFEHRWFSAFEGGMSAASFLHSSFLQAINAVMLWLVSVEKVPQASEHLCPAKLQTRCDICSACQSICPFIPTDSGVPRTVDPQKSL